MVGDVVRLVASGWAKQYFLHPEVFDLDLKDKDPLATQTVFTVRGKFDLEDTKFQILFEGLNIFYPKLIFDCSR